MNDQIIPVKLKITNCFLIKGSQGYLMVDAGPPKSISEFQAAMKDLAIAPEDIKMIFITHGHWDHWGSLSGIVELTGAETAINYREAPWLEEKRVPCGRVNSTRELVNDPHLIAREMLVTRHYPGVGAVPLPGIPVKLLETPGKIESNALRLGEHN